VALPTVHAALARARAALERGRGADAAGALASLHRSGTLSRDDEWTVRATLAEAYLQSDDVTQAAAILGRPPESLREPLADATLSTTWRLHGRVAFAKGDRSRAIALQARALKFGELARDSRAIGLAHFELAMCYRQVGDAGIVREHLARAASALHAAGDKRGLALVHRLSGVMLGQAGRVDEATLAFGQADRLATGIRADDVVASVAHNRANLALIARRLDEARALAERSVSLYEALGAGHGLAVSLATLGQIYVQVGALDEAEQALNRALLVRTPTKFHETTGAVFDTLAQIHLVRGAYDRASEYLRQAGEAYGARGGQGARWYEWSIRVLEVKLAMRQGQYDRALALADELSRASDIPPSDAAQADLAACEALLGSGRPEEARERLTAIGGRMDARGAPANWAEFLRVRGAVESSLGDEATAYHDLSQSASIFDILGERFQAATSHLALASVAARTGARTTAARSLSLAEAAFAQLGAASGTAGAAALRAELDRLPAPVDAARRQRDPAVIRRLVEAALMPDLLAREVAAVAAELPGAVGATVTVAEAGATSVKAAVGIEARSAVAWASEGAGDTGPGGALPHVVVRESLGRDGEAFRQLCVGFLRPPDRDVEGQLRTCAAVARQGFDLCQARERPAAAPAPAEEATLDLLLPGFICASAAMTRVAEQIQRLQGQSLTVLITGESGTGKDLVARAIHAGSPRSQHVYLPFNCTTTTRELADSQLFGHRRGSFTGAVTDQPGLIRSAAGGTLFLDEVGDIPLDVQPKLLRFLEQGEILPVGEPRPTAVDVRVLAATNADLEQRVAEGRFREDLYYRLSIIRIEIPPLRNRREEIPHLCTYFLRDACERLDKPDVRLSSAALDVLVQFWWPGNVRQLRNEIQRAVALSRPGAILEPEQLSTDITSERRTSVSPQPDGGLVLRPGNLTEVVARVERDLIVATLGQTAGNISESARVLGLTRRGLYLKMRRLKIEGS
jgi:DNA-binding NtrC family response regulator/tetratricopeptide (TPR) repeat protein